jgi:hypothetical protein
LPVEARTVFPLKSFPSIRNKSPTVSLGKNFLH